MAGKSVGSRVRAMRAVEQGSPGVSHVVVRDFRPEDYPAVVAISNRLFPDHPVTVAEERFQDEQFARGNYFRRRAVALDPSGRVVGDLAYGHMPWAFHPDRYMAWLAVHPDWQSRGVG